MKFFKPASLVLLLSLLTSAVFSSSARASDLELQWKDGTPDVAAILAVSIRSEGDVVDLIKIAAQLAASGLELHAVKLDMRNTTDDDMNLSADSFHVSGRDDTYTIKGFIVKHGDDVRWVDSLWIAPDSRVVAYGVYACPHKFGALIARGGGTLNYPHYDQ